jgi:septal ring-binding cell division protein DamX
VRTSFEQTGEIASLDLLAALLDLARDRGIGGVRFERPGDLVVFGFESGDLVFCLAPERSSPGQILIRSGKIQPESYRSLAVPEGEDRFSVAVAAGVVSRREAAWAQKISAVEALAGLLAWTDGTYLVSDAAPSTSGDFRLPVPRWVLELFLRSRDRSFVMQHLGPLETVLHKAEDFTNSFAALGLTADADSVVARVDGKRTVSEVAGYGSTDEFSVFKLMAALVTLGLLRPEWDQPFPAEAPAAAETPAPPRETVPPDEPFPEPPAPPADLPEPVAAIPLFAVTAPEPGGAGEGLADEVLKPPAEQETQTKQRSLTGRFVVLGIFVFAGLAGAFLYWGLPKGASRQEPGNVGEVRPAQELPSPKAQSATAETSTEKVIPSVEVPPPSPAPAPAPTRPRDADSWETLAQKGEREFAHPGKSRFTIQLEIACQPETLRKAFAQPRAREEMWIVPFSHQGRSCYRVLWGRFHNREAAHSALAGVPRGFSEGNNRPAVIALGPTAGGRKGR